MVRLYECLGLQRNPDWCLDVGAGCHGSECCQSYESYYTKSLRCQVYTSRDRVDSDDAQQESPFRVALHLHCLQFSFQRIGCLNKRGPLELRLAHTAVQTMFVVFMFD